MDEAQRKMTRAEVARLAFAAVERLDEATNEAGLYFLNAKPLEEYGRDMDHGDAEGYVRNLVNRAERLAEEGEGVLAMLHAVRKREEADTALEIALDFEVDGEGAA